MVIRPRGLTDLVCPYCHGPLVDEHALRSCSQCGARHHRECLALHGGCAVHGCEPPGDDMTDGWTIDPDDSVPLGDQIVYRVLYAIAREVYRAGDRVPTVRDVATRLRVNPNTVSKAYRDLERDGVLVSRRGAGVFVSEAGPALARERRQSLLLDRFERAVREALEAGLTPDEFQVVLGQALENATRGRGRARPADLARAGKTKAGGGGEDLETLEVLGDPTDDDPIHDEEV